MTKKVIETVNGWYMGNSKQKVELDDIVGLVKTDEPTDSVQLKKEAQLSICEKRIIGLENENEELKQRNNRQAKQLDRLFNLIEQKDWKALNDILDDIKRCDEQLQREWGSYGDV